MKRIANQKELNIHLENDCLIMYGSSTESSGCVLRGAISLKLNKPTRCKSLSLNFLGKISVSWNQVGNGCERKFRDSRVVKSHTWTFLSSSNKHYLLSKGSHMFEFELILPGNLPETTCMGTYYSVNYRLKAVLEKPTFSKDSVVQQDIHLSRQKPQITHDFKNPIVVSDQWENKVAYEFSMPTKIYTYGDYIPVNIKTTPLVENLKIRFVSCAFKEHFTCRATHGWFNGKTKFSRKLIEYNRKDTGNYPMKKSWSTTLMIKVPSKDIQCDAHNDSVQVWHTLSFTLSLIDQEAFDIKVVSPIIIAVTDSIGFLPSYQDIWQTLPYDPLLLIPHNGPPSYCSSQ